MPVYVISSNVSATTTPGYTLSGGDQMFIMAGVAVSSRDTDAIVSTVGGVLVQVAGAVIGNHAGINLGSLSTDLDLRVEIAASGYVSGGSNWTLGGVDIFGTSGSVVNYGFVSGFYGIQIGGGFGSVSDVFNAGTITGRDSAIAHKDIATDTLHLVNTGTIIAAPGGAAISGSNVGAVEIVINRGLIVGDVYLKDDNDSYVSRGGSLEGNIYFGDGIDRYLGVSGNVTGAVYGGAGTDTFFGNEHEADVFVGGADVDTLDFRLGGQVTLALDLSFAQNGAALGDTYFEMENVFGSDIGNDVIRGNGAANALFGWGGNDSLDGASGNDVLRGGTGIDTLTGGIGNDTFRFSALNECGDVITDFGNILSSDDRFQITAAAFGGGLVAGALAANQFITRADNLAQDADDRFIFNTTDRTLWFDADGNGAGAAVMVADLQAGAIVTAADILLI